MISKNALSIPSLIFSAIILLPTAKNNFTRLTADAYSGIQWLSRTNFESRNLMAYGDTTGLGYGYLNPIVAKIPDSDFFPVVRYQDYAHQIQLVLPGHRNTIDERMLVGIDIPGQDIAKNIIARAESLDQNQAATKSATLWAFVTGYDYDTLTGFHLRMSSAASSANQNFKIALFESLDNQKALEIWAWNNVPLQPAVYLELPNPLKNFSFTRGATPFLLRIENSSSTGQPPAPILGVAIEAIKVDLSSYTIVHHRGSSFTALRKTFLNQIAVEGPESWRQYLNTIQHD